MAEFVTKPDWLAYPDAEEFLPEAIHNWAVYYKRVNGVLYFKCDIHANSLAKEWQPAVGNECSRYENDRHRLIYRPKAKTVTTEQQGAGHSDFAWLDF